MRLNDTRPNGECLLATGFVERDNPANFLLYEAELVQTDRLYTAKRDVLQSMGLQVCKHLHRLQLSLPLRALSWPIAMAPAHGSHAALFCLLLLRSRAAPPCPAARPFTSSAALHDARLPSGLVLPRLPPLARRRTAAPPRPAARPLTTRAWGSLSSLSPSCAAAAVLAAAVIWERGAAVLEYRLDQLDFTLMWPIST